jgi:CRISPR/Cas system CSM-associated protein Csm2 small subunit
LINLQLKSLRNHLIAAVQNIGYPSQSVHLAQMEKIRFREFDRLLEAAKEPNHRRFSEAWMILAVREYSHVTQEKLAELYDFLLYIIDNKKFKRCSNIAPRVIDTFIYVCIARTKLPTIDKCNGLLRIISWYIACNESIENLTYLFDRIQSFEQTFEQRLHLEDSLLKALHSQIEMHAKKSTNRDYNSESLQLRLSIRAANFSERFQVSS